MSRYRLEPAAEQEKALLRHCSDARFTWNLCVEQESAWRPGRGKMPRFAERCRQLTEARAASPWLAEGSIIVQQQAVRDHDQAMRNFFAGTHRCPAWRKAGRDEGFRIVAVKPGDVRRLNRNHAEVKIPKAGWVRFRWSRPVPDDVKSFRVTRDRSGRWHVAFAVVPGPVPGPGTGNRADRRHRIPRLQAEEDVNPAGGRPPRCCYRRGRGRTRRSTTRGTPATAAARAVAAHLPPSPRRRKPARPPGSRR